MTGFVRSITVAGLRDLLAQLEDTDELRPNRVENLSIVRNGEYVGYLDLHPLSHGVAWLDTTGMEDDENG